MKYRKKPVVIEAEIYHKGMEDGFLPCGICKGWLHKKRVDECDTCSDGRPYINTLEGKLFVNKGDYIITGIKGERYPCKPDIFEVTYEQVNE